MKIVDSTTFCFGWVTQRVSPVGHELFTLSEDMSSILVFVGFVLFNISFFINRCLFPFALIFCSL